MLSTAIILVTGILGFLWSLKARNPFTKVTSLLLSVSSLLSVTPHALVQQYAPYVLVFASLMAGFEPSNSARIKSYHKAYFGIAGVLFAVVAIDRVVRWPFELTLWPLVLLFLVTTLLLLSQDKKMLRTRLGMIVIWAGLSLKCLLTAL